MNVAILTLFGRYEANFGNKLQNYAVERIYSKLNCRVTTLVKIKPFKNFDIIKLKIKWFINYISGYKFSKDYLRWIRWIKFWNFDKKWLHIKYLPDVSILSQTNFDYYSVGSDQVWNPNEIKTQDDADWFFLNKITPSKKVCVSPSFSVTNIPKEKKQIFKDGLNGFQSFSVREDSGKDIIRQFTGKESQVLIDPTLALEKEEWDIIQKRPEHFHNNEKYCLCYFLGPLLNENWDILQNYAKQNKMNIYNIMDKDSRLFAIGPDQFIWLIKHAQLIFTDSFHGCVFSIIYEKNFMIFKRTGKANYMFSRLETLCHKFQLENRIIENITEIFIKNQKINYEEINKFIQIEKEKFWSYIRNEIQK